AIQLAVREVLRFKAHVHQPSAVDEAGHADLAFDHRHKRPGQFRVAMNGANVQIGVSGSDSASNPGNKGAVPEIDEMVSRFGQNPDEVLILGVEALEGRLEAHFDGAVQHSRADGDVDDA